MEKFLNKLSVKTINLISIISFVLILLCRLFVAIESSYYDFAFQSISLYKFFNLYVIILLIVIIYLNQKYALKFFENNRRNIFVFGYSFLVSVAFLCFFKGTPQHDSQHCVEVADLIVHNNFFGAIDSQYLTVYPFQFGYSLFIAFFKLIFGSNFLIPLQLFQIVCYSLANVYLHKITEEFFTNNSRLISITITLLWLVPYFLSSYVYGLSLGLSLVIFSIYNMFKYIKYERKINFLYALILNTTACFVKPNFIILSLTYLLYFLFIKNNIISKKLVTAFICGLNLILSLNVVSIVGNGIFKADLGKGSNQFSFLVMSTIDNSLIDPIVMYYTPPGFHNGYDSRSYLKFDGDYEKINEINKEIFTNQINYSIEHPQRFIKYYGLKFLSTWASNDFMVLLQYGNRVDENEISKYVDVLENGMGKFIYTLSLNLSCFMIVIGALFYLLFNKNKSDSYHYILLIYFLGGVLYHCLFEAKSIYIYPYLTLLIPTSVKGFDLLVNRFDFSHDIKVKPTILVCFVLAIFAFFYNQINTYVTKVYENYFNYEQQINLNEDVFVTYKFNTNGIKNITGLEIYIEGDLANDTLVLSLTGDDLERYYTYKKSDSDNGNYIRFNFEKGLLKPNSEYALTVSKQCDESVGCSSNVVVPYGPTSSEDSHSVITVNGAKYNGYTLNFKLFGEKRSNPFYCDENIKNPVGFLYYNSFERGQ